MGQTGSTGRQNLLILLSFLFFCSYGIYAQQSSVNLTELIRIMEERDGLRFSYLDEDVARIRVPLRRSWKPREVFEYLESHTLLRLEELEPGFFAFRSLTEVDLCGQVLDNYARERMGGATIEVLPGEEKHIAGEDGSFNLEGVPWDATLKIRFLGFLPRFVRVTEFVENGGECLRILMSEEVQTLREVVVYPLLTSGIESLEDGAARIRPDDFGLLPGLTDADVLQVLQALPGIESNQERVSDINIRGGTNAENLILWNGIKMYQSGHFFGLISAFQPRLTQEVIAYKNGTPARYGDGVSGLIMMNSSPDRPEYHSGGGGFNMISADAYGRSPIGRKFGLEWSLRRSHTDLWESPVYRQYTRRVFQDSQLEQSFAREEDFFFEDFSTRLYWDIDRDHNLRLSVLGIRNRLDSRNEDSELQSELDQDNLSIGLEWNGTWNRRLKTRLLLYQTDYDLDAFSADQLNGQDIFQRNDVLERKLSILLWYELSRSSRVVAGYDFIETGISNQTQVSLPPFSSRIKGVMLTESTHAEWQVESTKPFFKGRLGVRLNAYNNLNTFRKVWVEPRVAANFRVMPHLSLNLLGESKSQATLQVLDLEQNFLGIEKNRWILANETSLPVVRSEQLSAGLEYERDEWYGSLSIFSKEVTNISTSTQGFQNFNQFSGEIGSYQVQGAELLVNYRDRAHSHWVGYAFNQNTYDFPDLTPPNFPGQQDVRHALSWGSTLRWERWYFGLGGKWRSGRPYTRATGLDETAVPVRIAFEETNSSRLPSYFRFDASISYRFPIDRRIMASVSASVLNLTNRANVIDRYYRISEEGELRQIDNFSLGLTPDLSFRIQF